MRRRKRLPCCLAGAVISRLSKLAGGMSPIFLGLVAAVLVVTALAKFHGATANWEATAPADPVTGVNLRLVLAAAVVLELAVAGFLLFGHNPEAKYLVILWLSALFTLYRVAHWWVSPGTGCPCLGRMPGLDALTPTWGEELLSAAVVGMFLGSLGFLLHPTLASWVGRLGAKGRCRLKWVLIVAGCLLLLPPLQVGCVAVVRPVTTGPMLLRAAAGSLQGRTNAANQFVWRDLDEVPAAFLKAVVAAEDRQFFRHHGFNWEQIRMAIGEASTQGRPPRGASTITQQCARSLFLWQGRSWIRKGLEAYYTIWMELLLSKRRILELYVNVIELGNGIYGVEAGAQHHYHIPAKQLTSQQATMLAVLLPSPKHRSPNAPTERLRLRQEVLLAGLNSVRLPWERTQAHHATPSSKRARDLEAMLEQ